MGAGPARDFFHDILLSPTARTRGLLNPRTVTQLMRKESALGRRLWGLLNLELWLREFIDGARVVGQFQRNGEDR